MRLGKIDNELLTPFVRKALERPGATITEWSHQVVKGEWQWPSRLVCRFFGKARSGGPGEELSWSIFLKIPNSTDTHHDEIHREPFQREPLLFQHGVLTGLPGGIEAPRCLAVVEQPDDEPWMWLEHAKGVPSLQWPLERFPVCARHFGRMQGAIMNGHGLPRHQWLDTSAWLPRAHKAAIETARKNFQSLDDNPLTRELRASPIGRRVESLIAESELFLRALQVVPKSLCHGDFNYLNLFAWDPPGQETRTVVIDWQYAGIRPIGGDISGFIADSSIVPVRRAAAEPEQFVPLMLEAYVAGLAEGGWRGDGRVVRFAVLAELGVWWTFNLLYGVNSNAVARFVGKGGSAALEAQIERYREKQSFLLGLADEARTLRDAGIVGG